MGECRLLRPVRLILVVVVALAGVSSAVPVVGCLPTCDVLVTQAGYAPGVVAVDEQVTLRWRALDAPHTATSAGCFHVEFAPGRDASAQFDVRGDELWVKQGERDWTRCTSAERLDDGRFSVTYSCLDHPHGIAGRVLVVP